MARFIAALVLAVAILPTAEAEACSTCTVGDPTITALGLAQPYRDRLRLSLTARQRRETIGSGEERLELLEHRFELGASWAPADRWMLSLLVPVVQQRVRYANLARERRFGLGDIELRARAVLFRDRALAPRHLLSAVVGIELPTAPPLEDGTGQLRFDLQTGSGSADPFAGLVYSRFAGAHSVHLLSTLVVPTPSRFDVRGGPSWRSTLRYQWQPRAFGLTMGVDGRLDGRDHGPAGRDANSGGGILWIGGGLLGRIGPDVIFRLEASVPVLQRLRGGHDEGVALIGSVVLDV